jgi:hypothetical protein
MTTEHRTRRVLAAVALSVTVGLPAEIGVTSLVATPAHVLSCHDLANAMFKSKTRAVYWARRYTNAGC